MGTKAVIFDLFGTLVNNFSRTKYVENLNQMAQIMELDPVKFREQWIAIYDQRVMGFCRSPEECIDLICRFLKFAPTPEQISRASKIRLEFVKRVLVPREDTIRTLKELKSYGLNIGLLSDCSTEVPFLWPETEFAQLFDTTIFSCNESAKKPMPKIYISAAERLHTEVTDCVFVGDGGSLELTGAQRIGMQPIRISAPQDAHPDAMQMEPDPWIGTTIHSLSELLPLFSPNH